MALLRMHNGKDRTVTPEQAATVWGVLNGEIEPDEKQERFCLQVESVFFNWRNAPDSYIEKHLETIIDHVLGSWMCDRSGNLTRPNPADKVAWAFAKRWKLIEYGSPSQIVRDHAPVVLPRRSVLGGTIAS